MLVEKVHTVVLWCNWKWSGEAIEDREGGEGSVGRGARYDVNGGQREGEEGRG